MAKSNARWETLVDAAGYPGKLCRAVSPSKLDHLKIDLTLAAPPLPLESDQRWRLGMIVSELITNAARHAFAGGPGKIRVELFRAGGFVKCTVCDNGSAPAHIQAARGLRIVAELTRALDGCLKRTSRAEGTAATLVFPYAEPERAGSED
jgi:two-component sensor histidine kinase